LRILFSVFKVVLEEYMAVFPIAKRLYDYLDDSNKCQICTG